MDNIKIGGSLNRQIGSTAEDALTRSNFFLALLRHTLMLASMPIYLRI